MCPITSHIKGYPFEVIVKDKKIIGAILADQIRSLDWKERKVSFIKKISTQSLSEVQEKIIILIK